MLRSRISRKISESNGIQSLMDDLSSAFSSQEEGIAFLGGGNPARIPEVDKIYSDVFRLIADSFDVTNRLIGEYSGPVGNANLKEMTANYLGPHFSASLKAENISFFNGSQNAFSFLLNAFSGTMEDGSFKQIILPIVPEYIGYADQPIEQNVFSANLPEIEHLSETRFRYNLNKADLDFDSGGIITLSRPTNPTGNVLSLDQVNWLYERAQEKNIPLLIDLAYGNPFPNLIGTAKGVVWRPGMILSLSFSKVGLPGVRFGIVIADEEVSRLMASFGAIGNLAVGNLGGEMARIFWKENTLVKVSNTILRPYYEEKCLLALAIIEKSFVSYDIPYSIHVPEGAFFLWIYFPTLTISNQELYNLCKKENVYVVSGHYFFPGLKKAFSHEKKCIRLTYCRDQEEIARGAKILSEIVSRHISVNKNE